jgi:hypothetical protein
MSPSPLYRLAGPLTLAAGALFTATQFVALARVAPLDRADPRWRAALLADPVYLANGVAYFGAFCLLLIALVAVYERAVRRAGALAVIGVCAALVGTANLGGNFWFEGFVSPWLAAVAPDALNAQPSGLLVVGALASYALFSLGWIVFGLAGLRARAFPMAIGFALAAGGLLGFNASPPFGVPLGLALAWLGVWLTWAAPADGAIPEPATA